MGNKRTLPNAIAMSTGSAASGKRNDPLGWRATARRTVRLNGKVMAAPQPWLGGMSDAEFRHHTKDAYGF
jgi:hypothetical protein